MLNNLHVVDLQPKKLIAVDKQYIKEYIPESYDVILNEQKVDAARDENRKIVQLHHVYAIEIIHLYIILLEKEGLLKLNRLPTFNFLVNITNYPTIVVSCSNVLRTGNMDGDKLAMNRKGNEFAFCFINDNLSTKVISTLEYSL